MVAVEARPLARFRVAVRHLYLGSHPVFQSRARGLASGYPSDFRPMIDSAKTVYASR